MTAQRNLSYRNAASALLLANTPLFLLRKLQSDSAVAETARNLTDDGIMRALKMSAQQQPTGISEEVLPYVYLVALSLKGNRALLKQAADIDVPYAEWFKYIANYLVKSGTPTSTKTVSIILSPKPTIESGIITSSSLNTNVANIKVPEGH
jgi:hypothetical protein